MNAIVEERRHALLPPSSAHTWIDCAASTAAQIGQPDESSQYADDGTASHELAKWCLENGTDAFTYLGTVVKVGERKFEVDEERAEVVQLYVDAVRARIDALELAGAEVTWHVEVALPIAHITGEEGATGTSDIVIVAAWANGRTELEVWDLKYGRGVEVVADHNYQAMLYAAGAIAEYPFLDFDRINLVIHQPRVNPVPSEWATDLAELLDWVENTVKPAAKRAFDILTFRENVDDGWPPEWFNPGEKQCLFCRAKPVCPAFAQFVENTLEQDFETVAGAPPIERVNLLDNDRLGVIYPTLSMIESWAKAVLARIEYELLNGATVPGVKLVQGRRGARQWSSLDDAEKLLKGMRLKNDEMYNFKLISPTQAEKLLGKESPRRWKKAEALIVQREGSPSIAPESDKRPALVLTLPEDDFTVVGVDEGGDSV